MWQVQNKQKEIIILVPCSSFRSETSGYGVLKVSVKGVEVQEALDK